MSGDEQLNDATDDAFLVAVATQFRARRHADAGSPGTRPTHHPAHPHPSRLPPYSERRSPVSAASYTASITRMSARPSSPSGSGRVPVSTQWAK